MSENQEMKDSSDSSVIALDETLPTSTETTESFEFFPSYSQNRKYQKLYKMLALVFVCSPRAMQYFDPATYAEGAQPDALFDLPSYCTPTCPGVNMCTLVELPPFFIPFLL